MALRPGGRKLSFDLLAYQSSGDEDNLLHISNSDALCKYDGSEEHSVSLVKPNRKRKKHRGSKKKKNQFTCSPELNLDNQRSFCSEFGSCRLDQLNGSIDAIYEVYGEETEDDPAKDQRLVVDGNFMDRKSSLHWNSSDLSELELGYKSLNAQSIICETSVSEMNESLETVNERVEKNLQNSVELRQRNVNGNVSDQISGLNESSRADEPANAESMVRPSSSGQRSSVFKGTAPLETAESLDWERLMAENSNSGCGDFSSVRKLPLQYFMEEVYRGNSLRTTTSVGNEKKRQRVYNTVFHVPWRCELLIDVGFFVCLDSFLSLLTVMPARILMTFWRFLNVRQFQRPCAAELSDFGCFVVLCCGIALLQATDISLIYHFIRGQGTIKLYVVYNVLEIFDKLCQSFGGDVLQVLFNSAEGVATCSPENMTFELMRFILDQTIAVVAFIVHSFILLAQAITLSTCIVAHNNALLALLVSNNFAEIKSNVFKRFSKENLHNLAYHDTVERFHITAFLLFVLAQNILEAEGPWFGSFITNALLVSLCEVLVDVIKHAFLAKFNEIKPRAYSDFLEDLCKQTLNIKSEDGRTDLTFVPLAPACVVIRVLTPIYAAHLPYGPLPWRLFWTFCLSFMTYIMLVILKLMVGMGLNLHATWYINRCLRRRNHLHLD